MEAYKPEIFTEKNCQIEIAGRLWLFKEMTFVRDYRGDKTIAATDLLRYQLSVAAHICNEDRKLTIPELELLSSLAKMSGEEVARSLQIDSSTVSKWKKRAYKSTESDTPISYAESRILKETFFHRLFEDERRGSLQKRLEWIKKKENLPECNAA